MKKRNFDTTIPPPIAINNSNNTSDPQQHLEPSSTFVRVDTPTDQHQTGCALETSTTALETTHFSDRRHHRHASAPLIGINCLAAIHPEENDGGEAKLLEVSGNPDQPAPAPALIWLARVLVASDCTRDTDLLHHEERRVVLHHSFDQQVFVTGRDYEPVAPRPRVLVLLA
jgi:hypothetical protein